MPNLYEAVANKYSVRIIQERLGNLSKQIVQNGINAIRRNNGTLIMPAERLGNVWTDSTGVTTATTVGDVIGKINALTGSNHATQATTASKPTLTRVPKRTRGPTNLFTYSGDVSNSAWTTGKSAGASVGAAVTGPDGQLSAYPVTYTTSNEYLYRVIANYPAVLGNSVTHAMVCNTATRVCGFGGATPSGTDSVTTVALGGGWHLQSVVRTFTTTTSAFPLQMLPGPVFGFGAGTVAYHRGALFEGAFTAQQIIDNGGIPLTTTQALPNVLEWSYAMSFDVSNDFLTVGPSTFTAGTLPAACDLVVSLTRKSSGQMLLVHDANAVGARFIGVMQSGSGLSAVNGAGTAWSVFVNGVQVGTTNSVTRAQLDAAVPVGVPVVVELRDLNMSTWTNLQIGNYTSFVLNADVTAIEFGASSAADRALIRRFVGSLQGQTL